MVEKYKLTVFDLDGTLVHTTAEYRYHVVPETLKKLAKPVPKQKDIDRFWFEGNRNDVIRQIFDCDKDIFWKVFHKLDKIEDRAKYTHAYDDVSDVLKSLKKRGKILAITTGAPKRIAEMEIDLIPKELFTKITSITSTRYKAKPHPESLLGTLKKLKIKNTEAVYIGNSTEDGEYALAAGVDFIFLERREHTFASEKLTTIHSLLELL